MNYSTLNPFIRFAEVLPQPRTSKVIAYDCRIFFILFGSGEIHIHDQSYSVKQNDLIYIPAAVEYYLRYKTKDSLTLLSLNFDLTQNHNTIVLPLSPCRISEYKPQLAHSESVSELFRQELIVSDFSHIKTELLNIVSEFQTKHLLYQELCSSILKKLLIEICRYNTLNKQLGYPILIEQIIQFIKNHYSETITENKLSTSFSYNAHYMNRKFKYYVGKTIHQYLIEYRISIAKKLLIASNLSIDSIAFSVGINDHSYFSYSFKKYVGMTPIQYRKTHKNTVV